MSGRQYSHRDLPTLRLLRDTYRDLLRASERLEEMEPDVGFWIAAAQVKLELRDNFERVGELLDRLEAVPPGRRVGSSFDAEAAHSSRLAAAFENALIARDGMITP